jgi:serine/threonine protein phosphatase PrpC
MKVNAAQLPGPDRSQDRVFRTANAAIVLDGATAFTSVELDAGTYADTLGRHIATELRSNDRADLAEVVSNAIDIVARRFELRPGHSPSSTVTIVRIRDQHADLFVLGDSPIFYGTAQHPHVFADTRLADLDLPESRHYRDRLRDGCGYDDHHRTLLRRLQEHQRAWRNIDGGYWIAEADPAAAYHAITATLGVHDLSWAVLATDGITNPLTHLGRADWATLATKSDRQLATVLTAAHQWEREDDPTGTNFPRAKCHDDKTIAAIPSIWL